MPIYANLYILREYNSFMTYAMNESLRYAIPATVGLNFAWYYGMRKYYRG